MSRWLLTIALVLAAVAALDAARGEHWDQFAMLVVLGLLAALGLALEVRRGRSLTPRTDLMEWVQAEAALTDDEPVRIVDRALAAYRSQLLPDGDPADAPASSPDRVGSVE